ncbi:uncharacterized protein LOC133795388 [Humulus lupulus]|uniref:uncharacterized protein LOC133795388 n=1 Tax=Humulus lupulus TaxID=3486 RepID=UPI002B413B8D|nr:uncharacterized protein LOC133795388 [Humulus lupulus]
MHHEFRFHPLRKNLKIINLRFADDLVIFCKANRGSVQIIKQVFEDFCYSTGMKANLSKSQVFFSGISAQDKRQLQLLLELEEGSFPLKYLVVPLRPTKWKAADCGEILKKLKLKLHTWSSRHLSYAGRVQLITSLLVVWGLEKAISHQQEALWVKWVHAVYLKGQNFWQYQLKADASWYWRKICQLREMFSQEEIEKAGSNGRFKVRQLYTGLFQLTPVNYKQFVWNRVSVPKHRFITWLAVNSKLLTRDHLQRVMQLDSSLCPVCDQELESHSHLLFGCYFSQQVVQKIHSWFGCSWPLIYSDWCRWIGGMSKGVRASKVAVVFSATVYFVWHNRNICVVHNYSLSIMTVVELIKNAIKCRLSAFFSDDVVKL